MPYSREEPTLGVIPLAAVGVATGAVKAVSGVLDSIFGGGPSKEQLPGGVEYEFRKNSAEFAAQLAEAGRRDAWNILGMMGRVKALPEAVNLPEFPTRPSKTAAGPAGRSYGVQPKGTISNQWGSSFKPVQDFAKNEYNGLSPVYSSEPAQTSGTNPVLIQPKPSGSPMGSPQLVMAGGSGTGMVLGLLALGAIAYGLRGSR